LQQLTPPQILLSSLSQESLFYLSEAVTTLQWGRLSDRVGRKPPLVFGTLGLAAAVTAFGLSTSFVSLAIFRSLQGIFNGNIGITKAVLAEITDSSNVARGQSAFECIYALITILTLIV
jgi:MFS family permease